MRWPALLLFLAQAALGAPERNLILITLDGVRHEEFFGKPDPVLSSTDRDPIFPFFWSTLASEGTVYGEPKGPRPMVTGNPYYVSLPGYESIFSGRKQPCSDNDCGRVGEETFLERLARERKLGPQAVASIASWDHIPLAVEHVSGAIFTNAAFQPVLDDPADAGLRKLNLAQKSEVPRWSDARFDRFTFAQGIRYLKQHHPRLLYLSFNDADEWGHLDEYAEYLKTLRGYDGWLKELRATLEGMGDYGKQTCLMITTDHGRGAGKSWTKHGPLVFHAEDVWLYTNCFSPGEAISRKQFSHLDIRPTVEAVFGLAPRECPAGCGKSLFDPHRELAHTGGH